MPRSVRTCQFLLIQVPVFIQQNSDTSLIQHYSLSYMLSVRPLGHHAGLPMLDCWSDGSRVAKYLHNARQGLMLLHKQIIERHGQHAISPFLSSAGKRAQQQEQWSVSPLSFLVKALQAKSTAAVACSSITTNASFVKIVRPSRANMPSCCRS